MDKIESISSQRTKKAKKNIIVSLLLKGASMVISFVLIPMTIGYLSTYEYGVWLTLSSLLHWIDFMDIGLGNGLRNKLSESLAANNIQLSKSYVSTAFFALAAIITVFYVFFVVLCSFVDWYSLLNVAPEKVENLKAIVLIVTGMMCLNFVLKNITYVYFAKQVALINNLVIFAGQLFSFISIWILIQTTEGALWKVASIYSSAPVIILLLLYPYTFGVMYKELNPSLFFFKKEYLKDLLGLGISFFFLKIGGLLIFTSSNFIISKVLAPDAVTPYSICQKYYSIITMIFTIIVTPMWSASTEAYVRDDTKWLRNAARKMFYICLLLLLLTSIMTVFNQFAYKIWLKDAVVVPMSINIIFAIYVTIVNVSTCYSHFLFGMGKLRLQIYSTVFSGILFIAIAPYLTQMWGISGAAISLCIANLPAMILNPIQFLFVTDKSSSHHKIWYK